MKVKVIKLREEDICINKHAKEWCKLPYPLHPKGCPNYNNRKSCPPNTPDFMNVVRSPYYLVGVRFDLENHIKKMKTKHSQWSIRQCKCVLYWQGHVNKILRNISERLSSHIPNSKIVYKPEALGVQLFNTCYKVGIKLERNPRKYVWKIAIVGIKC